MGFVTTISTHITDGNQNEERLVKIMGGTVIATESEKLIRRGISLGISQGISQGILQGKAQMMIEMGKEEGLEDVVILKRLQQKIGLSLKEATAYLEQYGRSLE